MTKTKIFSEGEIRRPNNFPEQIIKCIGPLESSGWKNGKTIQTEMFVLTNDFPKLHYIVIDRLIDNYYAPNCYFYLVYMITHSDGFNNMRIEEQHYSDTSLSFTDSYITRDKFLIESKHIKSSGLFGKFKMETLKKDLKKY